MYTSDEILIHKHKHTHTHARAHTHTHAHKQTHTHTHNMYTNDLALEVDARHELANHEHKLAHLYYIILYYITWYYSSFYCILYV